MKYGVIVARVLLGLCFLFFGANHILGFMKMPPAAGNAGIFLGVLQTTGYFKVIGLIQVVGGLLLIVGRFVPLGLTLLGPIIVNIALYDLLMEPTGMPIALVCVVLEVFLIFAYRSAFAGIFRAEQPALARVDA